MVSSRNLADTSWTNPARSRIPTDLTQLQLAFSLQFSVEESGCYIYCGTDSGDIVKLVVTVADDGVRESVGMQVQTCAVMRTGRGGGRKDVNAGKFAGGASDSVEYLLA